MARGRIVRRSFGGRTPQSMRRKTEWAGSADVTAVTVLAAGTAVLDQVLDQAALASVVPATIIRTVGWVNWSTDQVALGETPFGALGMAVVTEQAQVAGVAAIPTPITEEANDVWFLYQPFVSDIFVADATGIMKGGNVFEFDSRAQRKVQDGDAIIVALENASAAHGGQYIVKFRMLFKLH